MINFANLLSSTIVFAIPLIIVALAGVFSERSGIVNIALEGIMIIGALAGMTLLHLIDISDIGLKNQLGVFLAICFAGVIGLLYALLLAFASIKFKSDQVITGTALNIAAPALCIIIANVLDTTQHIKGSIIKPSWVRITQSQLHIADQNGVLGNLFSSFYLVSVVAVILFIIGSIVLYKTSFGLHLRSCGEHPQASDSVGINVYKMRYIGCAISGFLAGIGGLSFALVVGNSFDASVAGFGFLALAVMIFGNWNPKNIIFAGLFFALFKAVSAAPGSLVFIPVLDFPKASYVYKMIPYVFTLILLAFTSKNSRAPKAEGIAYDKAKR